MDGSETATAILTPVPNKHMQTLPLNIRIHGIPKEVTEDRLHLLLKLFLDSEAEQGAGQRDKIPRLSGSTERFRHKIVRRLSLASAASTFDSARYQVATVSLGEFHEKFESLRYDLLDQEITLDDRSSAILVRVDNHFFNLTPLNESKDPKADIIAVTGLGAHAFQSWKPAGSDDMWLRDYLGADLQSVGLQSRIMIYGYDSRVPGSSSDAHIHEYARMFIETLRNSRKSEKEKHRPIIFMGHSLGGLIVKHALIEAARSTRDEDIHKSCCGLLLFGVPNRGMNVERLRDMVEGQPNQQLISDLDPRSRLLSEFQNNFFRCWWKDAPVFSIYETQDTPSAQWNGRKWEMTGPAVRVVQRESAIHAGPSEQISDQLAINANHSNMVKFSSRTDAAYDMIRSRIVELVGQGSVIVEKRLHSSLHCTDSSSKDNQTVLPVKLHSPSHSLSMIGQKPHRLFVGRDMELEKLHQCFATSEASPHTTILSGLGGGGKTQIALRYAYIHRDVYSTAILVDASTQGTLKQGYQHYSSAIMGYGNDDISEQDAVSYVNDWLSVRDHTWLLIFDNLDSPDLSEYFEERVMPRKGRGHVIITTRNNEYTVLGTEIKVTEFPLDDAARLLLKMANMNGDTNREEALKIVDALGSLPLAVAQAGAYVKSVGLPLDKYLGHYEKRRSILNYTDKLWTYGKGRSAFTTWETSFSYIEQHNPPAAKWLLLCSFLGRKISEELLQLFCARASRVGKESEDMYQFPDWLLGLGTTNDDWDEVAFHMNIADLYNFSLIDKTTTPRASPSLLLHPLVQEWGKHRLHHQERRLYLQIAIHLVHRCCDVLRTGLHRTEVKAFLSQRWLLPHIESCYRNSLTYFPHEDLVGGPWSVRSALTFARIHWFEAQYDTALALQAMASRFARKDHPEYPTALRDYAATLRRKGGVEKLDEAARLQREALSMIDKLVDCAELKLEITEDLAVTYRDARKLDEALSLQTKVVEARKATGTGTDRDTLLATACLASIYYEMKDFRRAAELEEFVLSARTRTLGEEDPDTVAAKAGLAYTYFKQERYHEAMTLEERVLGDRKQTFGDSHLQTVKAKAALAGTYRALGRFTEAETLYREALHGKEMLLGRSHESTLRTVKPLCKMLMQQRRRTGVLQLCSDYEFDPQRISLGTV